MATLNDLPNELIYLMIAQLSYRDRARVACVSKECHIIADSEGSYKAQYIRDFEPPPQECGEITMQWTYQPWYHTSVGLGSEPPKRWKIRSGWREYISQESSWKCAYIRRHNEAFPQELYSSLPIVPYDKKHRDIEYRHRARVCHIPEGTLSYLRGLRRQSPFYQSMLFLKARHHGVSQGVEEKLLVRGWVLCGQPLDPIYTGQVGSLQDDCYLCNRRIRIRVFLRNKSRQERLREAEIGTRSSMAQVPIEFGTDLEEQEDPKFLVGSNGLISD